MLTDFKAAQFTLNGNDGPVEITLVDGPSANTGPAAEAVERTFERWNAKFNHSSRNVEPATEDFKPGRSMACEALETTPGGVFPAGVGENQRAHPLDAR